MNYLNKMIMVRFGELSTKGKNKRDFINILARNIKNSLKEYKLEYIVRHDHIYIDITHIEEDDSFKIYDILKDISGIHSFSIVYKVDHEIQSIKEFSLEAIKEKEGHTFKINSKRSDKSYPLRSSEIISHVAGHILASTSLKVDVHNPDIKLNIEIRDNGVYIFFDTYLGAGGYPLGAGGKALMMLSGGIDSPVASYLMMKRGIALEFIHFASPPYTSDAVIDKLKDILEVLLRYQPNIKLHIVRFSEIQEAIYKNSDESYCITLMRRMMYRISSSYAKKHKLLAIINGESIGQVASQTLNSMGVIDTVASLPIIRPLAIFDKLDIIALAQKIHTYDISIRPFEDCCTIFKPKNPKTSPRLDHCLLYEEKFDYETLIRDSLCSIETLYINKKEFEI